MREIQEGYLPQNLNVNEVPGSRRGGQEIQYSCVPQKTIKLIQWKIDFHSI